MAEIVRYNKLIIDDKLTKIITLENQDGKRVLPQEFIDLLAKSLKGIEILPATNEEAAKYFEIKNGYKDMILVVRERLKFIDFLLSEYGHVNRCSIIKYFSIDPETAIRDFNYYQDLAPANTTFDDSESTYFRTQKFERLWP